MGAFVADIAVPDVQTELNNRFAPGHPLEEMIAIQKEFDIFSHRHSLCPRLWNPLPWLHGDL